MAGGIIAAKMEMGQGKKARKGKERGGVVWEHRSIAVTKTVTLPLEIVQDMLAVSRERGISFSAAVSLYIRKGLAHDAILEAEEKAKDRA